MFRQRELILNIQRVLHLKQFYQQEEILIFQLKQRTKDISYCFIHSHVCNFCKLKDCHIGIFFLKLPQRKCKLFHQEFHTPGVP